MKWMNAEWMIFTAVMVNLDRNKGNINMGINKIELITITVCMIILLLPLLKKQPKVMAAKRSEV